LFDKFAKNKRKDAKFIRDTAEIAGYSDLRDEDKKSIHAQVIDLIAKKYAGDYGNLAFKPWAGCSKVV
jgi:hypothetical protein